MAEIRLVGTAHVSQKSIDEVRESIASFEPAIIAVELDPPRFAALKQKDRDISVTDILKSGNFSQLLVQWILAYLQRRIGMDVGVEPGAEMLAAVEEAERCEIPIALVDRDIRLTLSRFWRTMSLWEKIKLVAALAASIVGLGGSDDIDVDALTDQDVVTAALEEFRSFAPHAAEALIDERDAYIAYKLIGLKDRYERVLGVVGAGHIAGISRYLEDPGQLPPLDQLTAEPQKFPMARFIGIGVAVLFAILIVLIAFSGVGLEILLLAIFYWVLINGVLSALFTLCAGGHPLSALTAFGVSWLTSLNPLIAAGWFAAITEAKIRKPASSDLQAIVEAESFREMWEVPLFRVVLVAAVANIGSTIGTFAYFIFIFPVLGIDPGVVLLQGWENFMQFLTVITPL